MYRLAFETFRRTYPVIGFFGFTLLIAIFFETGFQSMLLPLLPPFIMLVAFRSALLELPFGWRESLVLGLKAPIKQHLAFWPRMILFYVVVVAIMILCGWVFDQLRVDYAEGPFFNIVVTLIFWFANSVPVVIFGTSLAAAAIGADASFKRTLRRSRLTIQRTILRLIAGPLVLFLILTYFSSYIVPLEFGGYPVEKTALGFIAGLWILIHFLNSTTIALAFKESEERLMHDETVAVF